MRKLIAGNWKMNGLNSALTEVEAVIAGLKSSHDEADILLCPPATLITSMVNLASDSALAVGGQTCHTDTSGAFTGDISAEMLADAGATYAIVGHSERRAAYAETNVKVASQAEKALDAGMTPIICCGESLEQREAGETERYVLSQIAASVPDSVRGKHFVVAYEPIWAIGTGLTASIEQIEEVHTSIRNALDKRFGAQGRATPILYGGSMKPGNAGDILATPNVDGGLIGGASLKAADFLAIYEQAK